MPSYNQYKRQIAVLDADDDIESWITVRGNHIPIKKGQSKEDAVKSFIESKGGEYKKESYGKHYVKYGEGENKRYASPRNDLIYSDKSRAGFFGSEKEAKEYAKKLNHTDPYAGTPFAMKNYKRTVLPYEVESEPESKPESKKGEIKVLPESKYDPDFETVRKNALANPYLYNLRYTQKSKAEAYKEYKNDTSSKEKTGTVVLKDPKTGKEIIANLSDIKSDDNVMPSATEYGKYLDTITSKTGISRENARRKYGQYTTAQWNDLLSHKEYKKDTESSKKGTGDLRSKFSQKYDELYKDSKKDAKYNYLVKDFDSRMKDDPQFKKQVQEFVKERGDVLSSDREVKAYMLAAEESGILKKRDSVSGLKESDGKIEFTRTTPSLKDITVKADSNGVTINGKHYKVEYDPNYHWKARKDGNVIKTNAKNPVEFAKRLADTDDANLGNLFLEGLTKKSATDSWKSLFDSADTKKRWSADWKKK